MRKEPLKLSNKKMTQLKMGERGGIKGRKKKKSGREVQADRRLASAVQAGTERGDAPPTCHQGGAGCSWGRLSPSRDEARSPHGTLRGVPWATRQLTSTRKPARGLPAALLVLAHAGATETAFGRRPVSDLRDTGRKKLLSRPRRSRRV